MATSETSYDFCGFRFFPDRRVLLRLGDGHPLSLTPKENALLLALIRRGGKLVTYGELRGEVWPENPGVGMHTVRETKHTLSKILGDSAVEIETVTGKGYRLRAEGGLRATGEAFPTDEDGHESGEVVAKSGTSTTPEARGREVAPAPGETTLPATQFGGTVWFVTISSAVYALLYVIALFVEVAYEYGRYGGLALRAAPFVFAWIFGTSTAGLWAAGAFVRRGSAWGLAVPIASFAGAGLLLHFALGSFLPDAHVTRASFQTYTAQAAYLKSVCYFLFLAALYLIIPYHFVLSMRREAETGRRGAMCEVLAGGSCSQIPGMTVNLRVRWLGILLLTLVLLSLIMAAHLFEALEPAQHMNLFMQLVIWRILIFLGLGAGCLLWYHARVRELARAC